MPLNYKLVETAMGYVRKKALVAGENVVAWPKYETMVLQSLRTEFDPRPKMPKEYYYAYLRAKRPQARRLLGQDGSGRG